ncbi:MAG: hypothetical protein AAGB12_13090, partial [Pseudomonadota bacterium]
GAKAFAQHGFHKIAHKAVNKKLSGLGLGFFRAVQQGRQFYNQTRPHSSLNNLSPEQFIQSLQKVA